LLCYTLVSVLVLGIGIASGQYYWVLDIGWLSWYRSNPTANSHNEWHGLIVAGAATYKKHIADAE